MMHSKRREELEEQLAEDWTALCVDQYMEEDGAAILARFEEEKARGEVAEIPEALDRKCRKLISRTFARDRRRQALRRTGRVMGRVAIVALVLLGAFAILVSSIEAIRIPVVNFFLEVHEKYTKITMVREEDASSQQPTVDDGYPEGTIQEGPLAGLLPEAYHLVQYEEFSNGYLDAVYLAGENQLVCYSIGPASGTMKLDTENAEVFEVFKFNGYDAFFVKKNGFDLEWISPEKGFLYGIYTNSLEEEAFWELAEALADRN